MLGWRVVSRTPLKNYPTPGKGQGGGVVALWFRSQRVKLGILHTKKTTAPLRTWREGERGWLPYP